MIAQLDLFSPSSAPPPLRALDAPPLPPAPPAAAVQSFTKQATGAEAESLLAKVWAITAEAMPDHPALADPDSEESRLAALGAEEAIAQAEAEAELRYAPDLDDDETIVDGEAVEVERNHWEEQRAMKARVARMDAEEWAAMNAPARDLGANEAEPDALALFDRRPWIDERHRFRALYRLRAGRERLAELRSCGTAKKPKAPLIGADMVERFFRITRHRALPEIALEAWQLIEAHDRRLRSGEAAPGVHAALDDLMCEANNGTSFGVRVNSGPKRLMKALRVIAKRQRRLPCWGVDHIFRFECRGMPVIADYDGGLSLRIDRDRSRPGAPCWSETGFRSFSSSRSARDVPEAETPEQWARGVLERYIDEPSGRDGGGGLGGKLTRWWPWCVLQAAQELSFDLRYPENSHPARRERIERDLAECRTLGIDVFAEFPDLAALRAKRAQGSLL